MEVPAGCTSSSCQITFAVGGIPYDAVAVDRGGDVFATYEDFEAKFDPDVVVEFPAGCTSSSCQIALVSGGVIGELYQGVAVDGAGDLFVLYTDNNQVLKVPAGCTSSSCETPMGTGFNAPEGLAVDGSGNLFIADSGNNQIVELQPVVNFGSVSSFSSLALNYYFNASVTLGSNASVLTQGSPNLDFALEAHSVGFTCRGSRNAGDICTLPVSFRPGAAGLRMGAVQLLDSSGNLLVTTLLHGQGVGPFATLGPATQVTTGSGLSSPSGVAVDGAGDVFIAEPSGVVEVPVGCTSSSCQIAVGSGQSAPFAVALDGAGNVFAAEPNINSVVEIPAGCTSGSCQITVSTGSGSPLPFLPLGVAVDGAGDVFATDPVNGLVLEIPAGCASSSCQITVATGLSSPAGAAVDGAGDVFVGNVGNSTVTEIPANCGSSSCQIAVGSGLNQPYGVAVDGAGDVFIGNYGARSVVEVPAGCASSSCQITLGSDLNQPIGVAVDGKGDIWIADSGNNRVAGLSPLTALSFAATVVGSTGTPQTVSVQNIGNAMLTFSDVVVSSNFSLDSNSWSCFDLAPGASCSVPVACTPTTVGNLNGTLTLTDNAMNGVSGAQTLPLSCIATAASQSITPTVAAPPTATLRSTFTVAAIASSGLPVTFASAGGCTNIGSTYIMASSGKVPCSVIMNQGGNAFYPPAAKLTETVTVAAAIPCGAQCTLTGAPASAPYLSTFSVSTSSGSDQSVPSIAVYGGACTVSGTTVTMTKGIGTCTIAATWAANDVYAYAVVKQTTIAALGASVTTIVTNTPNPSNVGQKVSVFFSVAPSLGGTTYPNGKVTVSDGYGDTCSVTLLDGYGSCKITITTRGSTTLTATYLGSTNFSGSTSAGVMQTVN
jgi:large repetitive protein